MLSQGRAPRVGIVGASGIGRMHIDGLRRIGVEVVAVVGTSLASAKAQAEAQRIPVVCADVAEMAARDDIDVIHICTPNALHEEQALTVIEANKHIVCEKPLATSVAAARRMRDSAEQAGVVHATAYTYRYFPAVTQLRDAIADGDLGRVHMVRGCYLNQELLSLAAGHWLLDPAQVGPALILADTGVHLWDMATHLLDDEVVSVVATRQVARPIPGAVGEDSAAVMMRFSRGAVASLVVSGAAPGHSNLLEIEVLGTEAAMTWSQENPDFLTVGHLGDRSEKVMRLPSLPGTPSTLQLPPGHVHGYLDAFRDLMAAIYAGIPGGVGERVGYPTFADGVRGVEILAAILESCESGGWVEVERG